MSKSLICKILPFKKSLRSADIYDLIVRDIKRVVFIGGCNGNLKAVRRAYEAELAGEVQNFDDDED